MARIRVNAAGGGYDVVIEPGLLDRAGERIAAAIGSRRLFVIADATVWKLLGERLSAALAGCDWTLLQANLHERRKRLSTVEALCSAMHEAGADRRCAVVAFGGGGNLLSAAEYADFVLRFEFKLEDGSNNGLCIRCPLAWSDLAYSGTELQIIDNRSERYANIQPWQKHGSLYHVFPARTGYLKPAGEWNAQEVTAKGSKIKVVLNGETILDVDTHTVKDRRILAKHPGLNRKSGHIGFLGHNEPVAFRNIRIKRLD